MADELTRARPGDRVVREEDLELPLYGLPANKLADSQPWEALLASVAQKNTEALALSLTGQKMEGDIEVSGGHAHDDADTWLFWRQVGAWQPAGERGSGPREGFTITETSPLLLGVILLWLPSWVTTVWARARVSIPAPGTSTDTLLTLQAELHEDSGPDLPSIRSAPDLLALSYSGRSYSKEWVESAPIDITGLSESVSGLRFVALRLAGFVGADGAATLWEYQVGLRPGP